MSNKYHHLYYVHTFDVASAANPRPIENSIEKVAKMIRTRGILWSKMIKMLEL